MPKVAKKQMKFTQIAVFGGSTTVHEGITKIIPAALFALDAKGQVWTHEFVAPGMRASNWIPFPENLG